jgi:hypothetical protein
MAVPATTAIEVMNIATQTMQSLRLARSPAFFHWGVGQHMPGSGGSHENVEVYHQVESFMFGATVILPQ